MQLEAIELAKEAMEKFSIEKVGRHLQATGKLANGKMRCLHRMQDIAQYIKKEVCRVAPARRHEFPPRPLSPEFAVTMF